MTARREIQARNSPTSPRGQAPARGWRARYSRRAAPSSKGQTTRLPRSRRARSAWGSVRRSTHHSFSAEQSARTQQQHHRHHDIDHRLAGGGQEHGGQSGGDPDQEAADQCSRQAADAADDDGNKAWHQESRAHGRLKAELSGREYAREAGKENADREIERAQHLHVDPERSDGLEIKRAGANANAEPRLAQQQKQQD